MSTKLNIINTLENSTKKSIVFLVLIGFAGLLIRLIYFPNDVPLFNDSQGYFWYAIDTSILYQLPPGHTIVNNGWPLFLSIIFQLVDSNNFIDYQNVQRFVGVMFSVATIFPVYFLCSRYFKKSYSLLGAALFVFEPRLIQNSFAGTPESMYVFLMALLLFLFLSNNFKKIYLAFAVTGLLAIIRYEGLLMIIPISVMFFIRFRKQKKDLIKFIICISIFILILAPMAYLKNETMGQDGFVSHISVGVDIQSPIWTPADLLNPGSINLIKYVGWSQIPSFIIFVPLGIIFIFKSLDYKKITIILSIFIMLIPAFYGYSRGYEEIKYLYVLYPIFCVLGCFTFKTFLEKFHKRNLIFCAIIGGIILSSAFFVEWKSTDNEHYLEAYAILTEIGQKEMKINKEFGGDGEFTYFSWITLHNVDEFPILQKDVPSNEITFAKRFGVGIMNPNSPEINAMIEEAAEYHNPEITSLRDYFQILEKQKITHLLLDEITSTPLINDELRHNLKGVFNHENDYPFLVKEYDSKENGFNYHVKLFKIDYDLYNELINEN